MIGAIDESSRPSGYANVCQTVISEVAATNGVCPEELGQTLNDVIDPDALERLFKDRNIGSDRSLGHIEFIFAGCNVMVSSSGDVSVSSLEEA